MARRILRRISWMNPWSNSRKFQEEFWKESLMEIIGESLKESLKTLLAVSPTQFCYESLEHFLKEDFPEGILIKSMEVVLEEYLG